MNGEIMLCADGNYSIGGEIDHVGKRERGEISGVMDISKWGREEAINALRERLAFRGELSYSDRGKEEFMDLKLVGV